MGNGLYAPVQPLTDIVFRDSAADRMNWPIRTNVCQSLCVAWKRLLTSPHFPWKPTTGQRCQTDPLRITLAPGPCKVRWCPCKNLATAVPSASPIRAEAFPPLLVFAVHLILDTEATFWPAFVTFCLPLPTGVAGLDQKISRDLRGIKDRVYLSGPIVHFRSLHNLIARLRTMTSSSIRMRSGANRRLTILGPSLRIKIGSCV